jgi:hypothetical protein
MSKKINTLLKKPELKMTEFGHVGEMRQQELGDRLESLFKSLIRLPLGRVGQPL